MFKQFTIYIFKQLTISLYIRAVYFMFKSNKYLYKLKNIFNKSKYFV